MSTATKVYSNIRGLHAVIKDVGRLRQILVVLAKHGFGAAVTRLGLHDTVGIKNLMSYTDEGQIPFSAARRLRMALEDLGPTFVKLGQLASTRSDLLPVEVVTELQSLQDAVPPMPWEEVETVIKAELAAPIETVFAKFEREPLASASIAQVHRAILVNGEDVVVKVQRHDVVDTIERDLSILHFLARRAAQLVPELQLVDPVGIVTQFDRAIHGELDFANERGHIERFRTNFAEMDKIHIPRVFGKASTHRLLTMEFVRGVKVTQARDKLGIDPYDVAPTLLRALFKMIFHDGLFHGDLHPGNILIDADGRIGLIDFGLVGRLSRRQRDSILDLLIGITREDYELVTRVMFELGVKVPGVRYDYVAFEADVTGVVERHVANKNLSDVDVQALFGDLVGGAIRHQIKMPPTYTMVFKALMTAEGIGKTLVPHINFIEEAKPFIRDTLRERYSPRRLLHEGVELASSASRLLRHLPVAATQLLRDAEQGQLSLRVEMANLPQLLVEQQRASRTQSRAIFVAGCVVGGAVSIEAAGPQVLGMSAISFGLLMLGVLVAVPLFWDWLRPR